MKPPRPLDARGGEHGGLAHIRKLVDDLAISIAKTDQELQRFQAREVEMAVRLDGAEGDIGNLRAMVDRAHSAGGAGTAAPGANVLDARLAKVSRENGFPDTRAGEGCHVGGAEDGGDADGSGHTVVPTWKWPAAMASGESVSVAVETKPTIHKAMSFNEILGFSDMIREERRGEKVEEEEEDEEDFMDWIMSFPSDT